MKIKDKTFLIFDKEYKKKSNKTMKMKYWPNLEFFINIFFKVKQK